MQATSASILALNEVTSDEKLGVKVTTPKFELLVILLATDKEWAFLLTFEQQIKNLLPEFDRTSSRQARLVAQLDRVLHYTSVIDPFSGGSLNTTDIAYIAKDRATLLEQEIARRIRLNKK